MSKAPLFLLLTLLGACGSSGPTHSSDAGVPEACDLVNPKCPVGEGCYLDAQLEAICAKAGTGEVGIRCDEGSDCKSGLLCAGHRCSAVCDAAAATSSCEKDQFCNVLGLPASSAGACQALCDPLNPTSCGSGSACAYLPSSSRFACVFEGSRQLGEACGLERCVQGLDCASSDQGTTFTCRPYCDLSVSPSSCASDNVCTPFGGGSSIGLCIKPGNCDPLDPASCGSEGTCTYRDGLLFTCLVAGTVGVGDVCSATQLCAPGLVCGALDPGATHTCLAYCDLSLDPSSCASGTVCAEYKPGTHIGLCIKPGNCDPLDPTSCGFWSACAYQAGFSFVCVPAGRGEAGDVCSGTQYCAQGYVCIRPDQEASYSCAPYCDLGLTPSECGNTARCSRYLQTETNVGVCMGLPCSVANGGCDPLTSCTEKGVSTFCGACPSGYTGTGASGCVPVGEGP